MHIFYKKTQNNMNNPYTTWVKVATLAQCHQWPFNRASVRLILGRYHSLVSLILVIK
jgi:hypothetical protein